MHVRDIRTRDIHTRTYNAKTCNHRGQDANSASRVESETAWFAFADQDLYIEPLTRSRKEQGKHMIEAALGGQLEPCGELNEKQRGSCDAKQGRIGGPGEGSGRVDMHK